MISALFASAIAAPQFPAGTVGLAHATAPFLGHPVAHPLGYAAGAHAVQPATISLPNPHTTQHKNPDVVTHHKPEPIITKQVHLGQTQYISGYATQILKPAIPDFRIAVPTALKGTQSYSAPIVTVQKEIHTVNEPVHVEKPYNVPYDVIKHVEKIIEVPTPYNVIKPYPVAQPYPVAGEPIIQKVQGAPIVRNHHHVAHAAPALGYAHAAPALGYAHHGLAGVAHAAPALGYAHHGLAGVPLAAAHGVAGYPYALAAPAVHA